MRKTQGTLGATSALKKFYVSVDESLMDESDSDNESINTSGTARMTDSTRDTDISGINNTEMRDEAQTQKNLHFEVRELTIPNFDHTEAVKGPPPSILDLEKFEMTINFINRMEYPGILLGKSKMSLQVHHSKVQKGKMNGAEKQLFVYINTILQHPKCLRVTDFKNGTNRAYTSAIERYVLFMAKEGYGADNFVVDGVLMRKCCEEFIESKLTTDGMETQDYFATIEHFRYACSLLFRCIGIYKTTDIVNESVRLSTIDRDWVRVPNISEVSDYAKERCRQKASMERDNFWNRGRKVDSTYTIDEFRQMMLNMYKLTGSGKRKDIFDGINSILEFNLGHHLLLRGQSKRSLELSRSSYDFTPISDGKIRVLAFKTTEGKTVSAKTGPQMMAAARSKDVLTCLVAGYVFSLWYRFDFERHYAPLFGEDAPDFLEKKDWYLIKVLFAHKGKARSNGEISYSHENNLVSQCFETIGFRSDKKTHVGRKSGARIADSNSVEEAQVLRAGQWNQSDAYHRSYSSPFPMKFILSSAGFREDEPYVIARNIEPPAELQAKIFPWIERILPLVLDKEKSENHMIFCMQDTAAVEFLEMLVRFRSVLLQDLAVLVDLVPDSIFCKHEITKDPMFLEFKARVNKAMENPSLFDCLDETKTAVSLVSSVYLAKVKIIQLGVDRSHNLLVGTSETLIREFGLLKAYLVKNATETLDVVRAAVNDQMMELKLVQDELNLARYENLCLRLNAVESTLKNVNSSVDFIKNFLVSSGTHRIEHEESVVEVTPSNVIEELEDNDETQFTQTEESVVDVADFAKQNPQLKISKKTKTVPELMQEWYESTLGRPSVEDKNRIYKDKWRKGCSTYKRRSVIIKFINKELICTKAHYSSTREELGRKLEKVRIHRNLSLNKLTEMIRKKEKCVREELVAASL